MTTSSAGSFTQLSVGDGAMGCGIRSDGTVVCWGDAGVAPPVGSFSQVSVGLLRAYGVRADGTIACWGPLPIESLSGTFLDVSTNQGINPGGCGVRTDQTLVCW